MHKYGLASRDDAVAVLSDSSEPPERRAAAADLLAQTGSIDSLPPLLNVLAGPDEPLAFGIANTLGSLGSRKATRPLLRIAKRGNAGPGRAAAIYPLGLLDDPRAIQLLGLILCRKDEQEEIRVMAADTLGITFHKRSLKPLLANHNESSEKIRFTVINSLGNHRGRSPVLRDVFRSHLDDPGSFPGRPTIGELALGLLNH